jgi:hypothetical protein
VTTVRVSAPSGLRTTAFGPRALRVWRRHLFLGNVLLCATAWMLYGDLTLRGYGPEYFQRAGDFWLRDGWPAIPGIENVLLPGIAAAFAHLWTASGLAFTERTFIVLAAIPYALFIYGLTVFIARRRRGGAMLAAIVSLTLYTSGLVPYMTTWGGSVDGLLFVALLPVVIWPNSLAVFLAAAVVQCLNHYAGVITLVLFAFVWHSLHALDRPTRRDGLRYLAATFVPRAALAVTLLWAFMWFWETRYPEAAVMRQATLAEKWATVPAAAGVIQEVFGPFPWTLLSTLKLGVLPVAALMWAPWRHRRLRALVLGVPFAVAALLTFVFVDVTRMAMMFVIPAWLVTVLAAAGAFDLPAAWLRRFRRLALATALLNVLIPNYYVNNGTVIVPPPKPIQALLAIIIDP